MSNPRWLKVILAILLIIAATTAWLTRDQRQINGTLKRLQELVSKSEEEKTVGGLVRAKEIADCFTVPMVVTLGAPWPDFTNRRDLATAVHHARSMVQTIEVIIRNKTLDISPDRKSATMVIAAEVVVCVGGQTDRDIRELRLLWVKPQGNWLISSVELKETIRRPQGLGGTVF